MAAVSVLVRTYNEERHVAEALESLLAQTFDDFEIVVVDGGSSDATLAIVATYADSRIRVVHQRGKGYLGAMVEALAEARGRYVAVLDADDRAARDRLARQVAVLERDPTLVLVGGCCNVIDDGGRPVGARTFPATDAAIRKVLLQYNPFAHSTLMYRRDAALRAGGYTTRFAIEDFDFILRIAKLGRLANIADRIVDYRITRAACKVKILLEGTVAVRNAAVREYGYRHTVRSAATHAVQQLLCFAPRSLVEGLYARLTY